ncbi:hypothetical protein C8A05DRAFT_17880 [Staphylotrichum tortipilum]|uniref:Glycosyl transferase CAP10 domain-containing protein n=1 Tax=Staphylotrichum tortipilum TaxID=2831512 RepID=A0AAN6MGF0_9PEZI|nr:hypothetical protein C8A05DRAFT_17880 [Staphylotrichum longicolle]
MHHKIGKPKCDEDHRIPYGITTASTTTSPSHIDLLVATAALAALAAVAARWLPTTQAGELVSEPALTPLVLAAERKLRPESRPAKAEPSIPWALANTAWGTALVALISVLAQSGWDAGMLILSILPAAALLAVYAAFIPRTVAGPRWLPQIDVEEDLGSLSSHVALLSVAALGFQTWLFGFPGVGFVVPALLLGLTKACSWYFTIQTARHTTWCVATAVGTFGLIASRDPAIELTEMQALASTLTSFLLLAQLIWMIPKQVKGRSLLWALLILSLGPYLSNTVSIATSRSSALHAAEHPIEVLARNARADFEQLLARQSKTYEAAVAEYQRRYGVEPPAGFEVWYEYAVANDSPIIDDFDTIYESVRPFWKYTGEEIAQIMEDAQETPEIDLWSCTFTGATAETVCTHPTRSFDRHISEMFNTLLGGLPGVLPDIHFLVNHLDEPRVIIPPASQNPNRKFNTTDLSGQPTWDALTEFCPSRHSPPPNASLTHSLPLITNLTASLDLCANPSYATTHGLFTSPASFRLIRGPVPILSTGAPSTMSDILIPSPAYLVEPEFRYTPLADPPWRAKSSHLYWAGSTTGGQLSHFRFLPWQPRTAPLRAKLAFDLDGNGISGRFHALLSSRSCVLKQTVLREWHADRVLPWVHYVPVSVGMGELPETVAWLLGTGRGEGVARAIGEGGAGWMGRAGRSVDAGVYLWRVLLEVGRVAERGRGRLGG